VTISYHCIKNEMIDFFLLINVHQIIQMIINSSIHQIS
jgi:hypothetical protein